MTARPDTLLLMNYYDMWVDLRDSRQDLAFCQAVDAYLGHLKSQGKLVDWTLSRRKFGFGPDGLGEFHIRVAFTDLAQLDACFGVVATRSGQVAARLLASPGSCARSKSSTLPSSNCSTSFQSPSRIAPAGRPP